MGARSGYRVAMRTPRRILARARGLERPRATRLNADASLVTYGRPRLRVSELMPGAWLVRRPAPPRRRVKAEALDNDTWIVKRGGRRARTVRPVGPPRLRADLVLDESAVRDNMRAYQLRMLHHLPDEHVAWILRELGVNCVLDVGANRGQYALGLRNAGYTGRIISFEPLGHFAQELEKHAGDDPDWHVVRAALGSSDNEAEMMVAGGEGKMSSFRSPSEFGKSWSRNLSSEHKESVAVRRLDGLYDDLVAGLDDPRVYLKLDTQGYDLEAFAGAGDRIDDVIGMQSEVACVPIYDDMPRLPQQLEVYERAGFELTGMYPVTIDRTSLRVIEFDAIMIRADARPG
jgi:FkbM family methyltransferase